VERLLEATRRAEAKHFWFRGFRRFVRPLLAEAAAGTERPRLLDCGCGTGANLRLLAEFGRPFGLDLTRVGLECARASGLPRLTRGTVACLPFPDGIFDVVTSFDVLYCLPDEEEPRAAAEMHRVLRPGGAAVVNVAAMPVLKGNHSVLSNEIRRYTPRRLRAVLETAGFHILRLTYTNATMFPLMLAVRTVQRAVGLASPDNAEREIRVPPVPINAALDAVLALESRVLGWIDMPFGSSLLCLARKPPTK